LGTPCCQGTGLRKTLGILFIFFVLLGTAVTADQSARIDSENLVRPLATLPRSAAFDYVVIVIMENHSLCPIAGDMVIGCSPATLSAPYHVQLAQDNTLLSHYTALAHPSPPNYVALIGGSTFNMTTECFPTKPCGSDHLCCPINATNIVDRFDQAGLTWKAYAEDYNGGCRPGGQPLPFNYFYDIYNNATRCKNLVNASTIWPLNTIGNPDIFLNDLKSTTTASNLMWLSPSSCDQWHHLCDNGTSQGDIYLSMIVPKILSSTIFTTQRAALFIVYDEGTDVRQGAGTCPIGSGDCAYAVWAGPQVKNRYVCGENYSHYSFLSTIEWNWGLQNLTSNDGSAPPMSEIFTNGPPCKLQSGFTDNTKNPQANQPIAFSGLANGGVEPYSFTWNFGDEGNGRGQTINHAYQRSGTYVTTLTVTDAARKVATSLHTLTVSASSICIPCFFESNPTASLLVIGLPVALTLAIGIITFVRKRHRKTFPKPEDLPRKTPARNSSN